MFKRPTVNMEDLDESEVFHYRKWKSPMKHPLVKRDEWGALPPREVGEPLTYPLSDVLFTHTSTENCSNKEDCIKIVKQLQHEHMHVKGLPDIRYNFIVGSDERVYEGRGWNSKPGEHEKYPGLFEKCVEFAYIGNYEKKAPPIAQQKTAWNLLEDAAFDVKIEPKMCVTEEYYQKGLTEDLERKYSVKYEAEREREAKERAEADLPVDVKDQLAKELEQLYDAQIGIY